MDLLLKEYNTTTKLILPMVLHDKNIKGENILGIDGYINAYIGDIDDPELDDKIIVMWDGRKDIYDIPSKFKEDYWSIVTSNYSKISDEYIEYLNDFWNKDWTREKIKESLDPFSIFEEMLNMEI